MVILEFKFEDNIEFNKKGKLHKLKTDNFSNVLNTISKSILYNGADYNGYTPIHNSKFNSGYTGYQAYLDYLLKYEYIENDYYIKGERSYGYRFSEFFKHNVELTNIIYRTKPRTTKKRIQKFDGNVCTKEHINDRLILDYKHASKNLIFNLKREQLEKTKDEWNNYYDIKKWLSNNIKLYKWKQGFLLYKWSRYRLYTSFTFLSSHIKTNNIRLNNEKIVEFDIKSSFPLMLADYCLDVNPVIFKNYEFGCFCTSITTGQFYNDLMVGLNKNRNITKGNSESDIDTRLISKGEAKILFQMYINGNYKKTHYLNGLRSDVNLYMLSKYPMVHEILVNLKNSNQKPFDVLAKKETKIIFEIIEELYQNYSEIRILTCHDAIYVPTSFVSETSNIWNQHMDKLKSRLPVDSDEDEVEYDDEFIEIV